MHKSSKKFKIGDPVLVSWDDAPDEDGIYAGHYYRSTHHVLLRTGISMVETSHLFMKFKGRNLFPSKVGTKLVRTTEGGAVMGGEAARRKSLLESGTVAGSKARVQAARRKAAGK